MYYEALFRALKENKVRYLVVGGTAMALHGAPKMTADLDLMLDMSRPNLARFVKAVNGIGFKTRQPVRTEDFLDAAKRRSWAVEKNMVVLTFVNPGAPYQELDVFIENPVEFGPAYKKKTAVKMDDIVITVAPVESLIEMKEKSGRKQDKSDIAVLKKLKALKVP